MIALAPQRNPMSELKDVLGWLFNSLCASWVTMGIILNIDNIKGGVLFVGSVVVLFLKGANYTYDLVKKMDDRDSFKWARKQRNKFKK